MKKFCLCVFLSCVSALGFSVGTVIEKKKAQPICYSVEGNYHRVKVTGPFDLELIPSQTSSVEIDCQESDRDKVSVNIENQVAHIRYKNALLFNTRSNPIKVKLYYTELTEFAHRGPGDLNGSRLIKGKSFLLTKRGVGKVNLNLDFETLTLVLRDNAVGNLSGTLNDLRLTALGRSKLNALDLEVTRADLLLKGFSKIQVHVKETLNAHISGSAELLYKGSPQLSIKKKGDAASIKQI